MSSQEIDLLYIINTITPFLSCTEIPNAVACHGNPCKLSKRERDLILLVADGAPNAHEAEKRFVSLLVSVPRIYNKFMAVYANVSDNLKHELDRAKITDVDDMDIGAHLYEDVSRYDQFRFANWIAHGHKGLRPNRRIAVDVYTRLATAPAEQDTDPRCSRLECARHLLKIIPKTRISTVVHRGPRVQLPHKRSRAWIRDPTPLCSKAAQKVFPRGHVDVQQLAASLGDIKIETQLWPCGGIERTQRFRPYYDIMENCLGLKSRIFELAKLGHEVALLYACIIHYQTAIRSLQAKKRVCIDPDTGNETDIINAFQRGSGYLIQNLVKTNRVYTKKHTWEILSYIAEWIHVSYLLAGFGELWTVQRVLMSAVDTLGNKRQLFQYWMRVMFGSRSFSDELFEEPRELSATINHLEIGRQGIDLFAGCELGSVPCKLVFGSHLRAPGVSTTTGVQYLEQFVSGPSKYLADIAKPFLGYHLIRNHDGHDCVRARKLLCEDRQCYQKTCPHFNTPWYVPISSGGEPASNSATEQSDSEMGVI